jgi:putative hydrolase of the HAD superfamily
MNIVFDFGNVLVEWNPARLIEAHYPQPERLNYPTTQLAEALVNHQDWVDFDCGLLSAANLASRSAARLGLDATDMHTFIERIPHVLPEFGDALSLMQALADGEYGAHRVLYLSNMPTTFADVLEARCPWIARFEDGIFSGRVNMAKPDAEIYAEAEKRFNLEPSQSLFMDDSPPNVYAARARGWHAEIIDSPQSVRNTLRKYGLLKPSPD